MPYGILKDHPLNNPNKDLIAVFATPLAIFSEPQGVTAESINFKRFAMEQTAQRWAIESDLGRFDEPPDLLSNRLVKGDTGTIYVQFPQPYSSGEQRGSDNVRLSAPALSRDTELHITGTLIANTFICVGSTPSKIYLVTYMDKTNGKCGIFPSLRATFQLNAVIYQGYDAVMKANYDTHFIRGMKYENGILATPGQIRLVEEV